MPLSPPWKWLSQEFPTDGQSCYFIRIGDPEKPILATWDNTNQTFNATVGMETLSVPSLLVAKWRPETP